LLALFRDDKDVYETIGRLHADIGDDEDLGPKFREADTIVRYGYTEPDSAPAT